MSGTYLCRKAPCGVRSLAVVMRCAAEQAPMRGAGPSRNKGSVSFRPQHKINGCTALWRAIVDHFTGLVPSSTVGVYGMETLCASAADKDGNETQERLRMGSLCPG